MMNSKGKSAFGQTYKGQDFSKEKDMCVPDQSLSLQEILDHFVRNEPIPVDMGGEFGGDDVDNPLSVDLEKMARADLTVKAEYYHALEDLRNRYKAQETAIEKSKRETREKAEKDKLKADLRLEIEAEKKVSI